MKTVLPPTLTSTPLTTTRVPSRDTEATAVISPLAAEIDAYLQQQLESADFSGAVLVARDGEVILSNGYGLADAERGIPNTAQTRFHLASVSKAFAGMAVMILQERGLLSVDDSLCKYAEECPAGWEAITLHHLLTHTSGLPVDPEVDFTNFSPSYLEALEIIKSEPLLSEPGNSYNYSNAGYIALGYVIEQASGVKYEQFVRDNIFTPLGMSDSGAIDTGSLAENLAVGYSEPGKRTPFIVRPILYPAGGLYSTVEDLYKWDQALYGEKLVKQETLDKIFTPNLNDYGYGWGIVTGGVLGRETSHSGHIGGFRTRLARFPDKRAAIIVLSNNEQSNVEGLVSELADILFR
jgi:CubicO group peptidase (beta-lactamase class C family)